MSSLWTRNTPVLPPVSYGCDDQGNYLFEDKRNDSSGCPSDLLFADSAYTLSFGQLLSGDLHRYQSCNRIGSYPTACSYERPVCCSTTVKKPCPTFVRSLPVNPLINAKVNEAMKTIRQTARKSCQYSIPSVPHCYNPIINQNHMSKAAGILEQAANAMSLATNRTKPFQC